MANWQHPRFDNLAGELRPGIDSDQPWSPDETTNKMMMKIHLGLSRLNILFILRKPVNRPQIHVDLSSFTYIYIYIMFVKSGHMKFSSPSRHHLMSTKTIPGRGRLGKCRPCRVSRQRVPRNVGMCRPCVLPGVYNPPFSDLLPRAFEKSIEEHLRERCIVAWHTWKILAIRQLRKFRQDFGPQLLVSLAL